MYYERYIVKELEQPTRLSDFVHLAFPFLKTRSAGQKAIKKELLLVDEKVEFFISDGLYKEDNNMDIDVVESFNEIADLDELLISEIELIKSDYHCCEECS